MTYDFSLNFEQVDLQRSVHDFFSTRCPMSLVREVEADSLGYSWPLWEQMADLGLCAISIPEQYGGAGGGFLDLYPVYEEFGRFLVPSPHLETVSVVGDVVLRTGSREQRADLLPRIAAGTCIATPAILESTGVFGPDGIELAASVRGSDYTLRGTKLLVDFANSAQYLLCAARTDGAADAARDGVTLFLIDTSSRGLSWTPLPNLAGRPSFAVEFDDVLTPASSIVGPVGSGWTSLRGTALKAAVLETVTIVGAAKTVLEMTNQYAKDRVQFGHPIGTYQAVQYLVTDILIDLHNAELLAKQAAYLIDAGKAYGREAALAVAHGKRVAAHAHRQAHEVHAGVGFILDHDLQLYSRRAKFWENNLGDLEFYLEEVAAAIL
jgi:alkylation response protein AidB-like acyl-CoA dehydrogenase